MSLLAVDDDNAATAAVDVVDNNDFRGLCGNGIYSQLYTTTCIFAVDFDLLEALKEGEVQEISVYSRSH